MVEEQKDIIQDVWSIEVSALQATEVEAVDDPVQQEEEQHEVLWTHNQAG